MKLFVAHVMVRPPTYSLRNAIKGSTFVARRAGREQARNATPTKSRSTSAKVAKSVALTP
jgi:hypothetical protein